MGEIDRRIAALAGRQHGFATRAQLRACGLSNDAVDRRVARGQLIRLHQGVYAVGHLSPAPIDRAAAAVLACGSEALLSHGSALSLWGLRRGWRLPFEVTTTRRSTHGAIRTYCCSSLARRDRRMHVDVPVTSAARTLLDCAPDLSAKALRRAVNDARLAGLLDLDGLTELIARNRSHPGTRPLRALIDLGRQPTRSEFEDAFLEFVQRHGLPEPRINVSVNGYEVDALFPQHGVIVELDGYRYHRGRDSFETDRERDACHLAAGLATLRITWERLTTRAAAEAERLHTILRTRRPS